MFNLRCETDPAWIDAVLANIDSFLIDHAACERKASATAMTFVVRYPDRQDIVKSMIEVAQDELQHFAQVTTLLFERGLMLKKDEKDPYVNAMLKMVRGPSLERLIDRLLIFGVVEGRGCERFQLVAEHINDPQLATFYFDLYKAEARHHAAFLRLVKNLCPEHEWRPRLNELLDAEAEIVQGLPIRPCLH